MDENKITKGYHYESYSTSYQDEEGNTYTNSSVRIRELDDGEVGILLAGNNSIFDPTLTPRMLSVPSDYDIISDVEDNDDDDDDDDGDDDDDDTSSLEEKWFPSLLRHSWIHGLDDSDDIDDDTSWIEKIKDIIYSNEVIEKENNNDRDNEKEHKRKRSKKSNDHHHRHSNYSTVTTTTTTTTTTLVPVEIVYLLLND
ncbi:unnamed protein product [Cunninghamella echinulata]